MTEGGKTPTGGCSGAFKRLWYYICFNLVGFKWTLIELFTRHRKLNIQKIPRRQGDVAVITGGARGIGVEVIKRLLILDMHVVIGCRNEQAGKDLVDKFREQGISTGSAQAISLDLTSLESVRAFAAKVNKKYRRINILINNAGIMLAPYRVTKDNFESHFQVNYLSHFLLTQLLLPKLKSTGNSSKPSRIINVSSIAAYGGKINFEDLQMSKLYSPSMAYMTTKMEQIAFTRHLENRLRAEGANVHVYAVHPGVVKTDLYENICWARVCTCFTRLIFKTPKQGSDCVLYAAVSPKVADKGGNFFANCKKESLPSKAKNDEVQKKLWEISCELAGLTPSESKIIPAILTIENEKNSDGILIETRNGVDSDSSSKESNPYESKSTDAGSLDELQVENQAEINKDIAKNIIEAMEVDTNKAIEDISKELVEDIVGKSEEIVNERVNTETMSVETSQDQDQVNSGDNLKEEQVLGSSNATTIIVEEIIQEQDSKENEIAAEGTQNNTPLNKINSYDDLKAAVAEINEISLEISPSSTKVKEHIVTDASGSTRSITKEYGAVSITEFFDSPEETTEMRRIPTPNITVTQASDAASDSDSDDDSITSLHKQPVDISKKAIIVEVS